MAWHTLNEAVKLTGRSRRSIYRDMDRGLVSYGLDPSGNRQFETSELIRAYGALVSVAQPGTPDVAHLGTAQKTSAPENPQEPATWANLLNALDD